MENEKESHSVKIADNIEEDEKVLFQQFLDWMFENGFSYSKIEIVDSAEKGRGLIAAEDLVDGDVIVEVPGPFVISHDTLQKSDIKEIIEQEAQESPAAFDNEHTRLIFVLLYEYNNPNSFWAPYFKVLPKSYDLPPSWDDSLIKELIGSHLYDETVQLKTQISDSYTDLVLPTVQRHSDYFDEEKCTLELYIWCLFTVYSRQYSYHTQGDVGCLVPLADLVNHKSELEGTSSNYYYDRDSNTFKVLVHESYEKGQEVWISYGKKSNEQYLLCYGFTNTIPSEFRFQILFPQLFSYEFSNDLDPINDLNLVGLEEKGQLLESFGLETCVFNIYIDEHPDQLLKALRVYVSTSEEIQDDGYEKTITDGSAVSIKNEILTYELVIACVDILLGEYLTTLEEDNDILEDHQFENQAYYQIVLFRARDSLGETSIINSFIPITDSDYDNFAEYESIEIDESELLEWDEEVTKEFDQNKD